MARQLSDPPLCLSPEVVSSQPPPSPPIPSPVEAFIPNFPQLHSPSNTHAPHSFADHPAAMSLQHLEFKVIHTTSWDEQYPPEALVPKDRSNSTNGGVRHGKGWQSQRLCKFPQEVILHIVNGPARLRKIQILSHHYKIATRLDIYVGSVQRRKEMVGVHAANAQQRTLSWEQMPKIIDNDGEETDDDDAAKLVSEDDEDYQVVRTSDAPYIHFRRLGYCALDSNERANYKARELKSVRLDTRGEYIRLVARRCHANRLNQHNQVGIVGITIMGEPVDDLLDGESRSIPIEHAEDASSRVASPETCVVPLIQDGCLNDQRNFIPLHSVLPSSTAESSRPIQNPIHSADFLINAEQTTYLINALVKAKEAAVKVEDFHFAKVLKSTITLIKDGAEEISKLDALKKEAVLREDYDTAESYKNDMEVVCSEIRDRIIDEGIELDENGEVLMADQTLADIIGLAEADPHESLHQHVLSRNASPRTSQSRRKSSPRLSPRTSLSRRASPLPMSRSPSALVPHPDSGHETMAHEDVHLVSRPTKQATSPRRVPPPLDVSAANSIQSYQDAAFEPDEAGPTSSTEWQRLEDNRPLPALFNAKQPVSPLPSTQEELADDEPELLSDLAMSAFAWSIDVFGERTIACLLSKKFKLREAALIEITNKVDVEHGDGLNVEGVDKMMRVKAAFQVLQEGLGDSREKLTLQTLTLWECITSFCILHQLPPSSTFKFVDQTYPLLFNKISDSNPRIKQSATNLFILLAKTYHAPNQCIISNVVKPAKSQTQPPKQAKAKVDLITKLVSVFGVTQIPRGRFDKDTGISHESVMEVAVSYLNHSSGEVRDSAVKLVVTACKFIEKEHVEPFLEGVKPLLLESIWKQVEEQGPPRPRRPPPTLTMLAVDESLLEKPLAKRGTVTRLQQQLMELRSMVNNVNHYVADDYETYIANATKNARHDSTTDTEQDEVVREEAPKKAPPKTSAKTTTSTTKGRTADTGTSSKASPAKRITKAGDGAAAPKKRASTSKLSGGTSTKASAKAPSRRGSSDTKAKTGNATQKVSAEPEEIKDDVKTDRCCIFCDEQNDDFTEENLVTHYWNNCPVLTKCPLCSIILEISTLDEHMLTDCTKSKFVKQCPRCREVLPADSYLEHIAKQTCMVIPQQIVRCPLCKTVIKPPTEAGWKEHLLAADGCAKNRRKDRSPATMRPEMEAIGKTDSGKAMSANKKEKSTGSKTTSKAPARKTTAPSVSSTTSKDKARKTLAKTSTRASTKH